MTNQTNAPSDNFKLSCRGVWKLFGHGGEALLREKGSQLSDGELAEAGVVGAVRDVSLDVRANEIFIIMGLSGSGKSTLVRCMSRLIEPTGGEILFNGENLLEANARRMIEIRRHQMGMVFQHFALLPHLTVLGNVAFPLEVQGMDRAAREKRAREVIELVGLTGRENFFPNALSGGQQQRVGIARSLAVEPEIWFLDEPFSALDPLIRGEMQDEFIRLQSVLRKTIVFITHDFDEAIHLADRIAIMKDGRVEQIGTPEELVLDPASEYVAEFTRNVTKAKVVRAGSLMQKLPARQPKNGYGGEVSVSQSIAEIAPLFERADGKANGKEGGADRLLVVDRDGNAKGLLTREAVVQIMMQA